MSSSKVVAIRRPSVLGTGLLALDVVYGAATAQPARYAGGTCGNVLTILSYLGWDAYPIARLDHDLAGNFVRRDLERWGVHLDFTGVGSTKPTPIIVERIGRDGRGSAYHTFSWRCPRCGGRFPSYQPVRGADVDALNDAIPKARVFFMDRVSRGALDLASKCASDGAVVVFEPSAVGEPRLFEDAIRIAHVLKYSDERMRTLGPWLADEERVSARLLEIETLGAGGLRYRLPSRSSRWNNVSAYAVPEVVDTAGAGDWCTAGIVDHLLRGGVSRLRKASGESVRAALMYGQALSAWNCGYEGARGGMYQVSRAKLVSTIKGVMSGAPAKSTHRTPSHDGSTVYCTSCTHGHEHRKPTKMGE